ncbi:MAG TPA: protein-L-isoaspartate(D-aspartate) O-methyltransferase [Rubricoccaceae bacterium]
MVPTDRQSARLVAALRARGIRDERVLAAIAAVPRHAFVEPAFRARAYEDEALPLTLGQTISQPSTVAAMTELLGVQPGDRILEVGTGSGYQAAVLAAMGAHVFSVERHAPIFERTRALLSRLGIPVQTRLGDGHAGWAARAPYDGIVVTAGGPTVPAALVAQLRLPREGRPDARLVIPVGPAGRQTLHRITRTGEATTRDEALHDVLFVPFVPGTTGRSPG